MRREALFFLRTGILNTIIYFYKSTLAIDTGDDNQKYFAMNAASEMISVEILTGST